MKTAAKSALSHPLLDQFCHAFRSDRERFDVVRVPFRHQFVLSRVERIGPHEEFAPGPSTRRVPLPRRLNLRALDNSGLKAVYRTESDGSETLVVSGVCFYGPRGMEEKMIARLNRELAKHHAKTP